MVAEDAGGIESAQRAGADIVAVQIRDEQHARILGILDLKLAVEVLAGSLVRLVAGGGQQLVQSLILRTPLFQITDQIRLA